MILKIGNTAFILFLFFSASKAQIVDSTNSFKLSDSLAAHILKQAYLGSHDNATNYHPQLSGPAGGCKACFMNIQHRIYGSKLSPSNPEHRRIAFDLMNMRNAFYDSSHSYGPFLVSPHIGDKPLYYQDYLKVKDQNNIKTHITEFIKDTIKKLENPFGYYVLGVGVASRYHLTHLVVKYEIDSTFKWYLFDNFGFAGKPTSKEVWNSTFMKESEVEKYYKKFLKTAVKAYKKSPTLKNESIAYGRTWKPYQRPLYAELYFWKPNH